MAKFKCPYCGETQNADGICKNCDIGRVPPVADSLRFIKQLVEELYALICNRISDPITYQELKNRKMGLDTKGIIPVRV